jgi:hypothetical protein
LLRRPAHENASIIMCRCLLCGYLVGASSFEISLHIAEMAHSCHELLQRTSDEILVPPKLGSK